MEEQKENRPQAARPPGKLQCRVSDQETNGKSTASNPNDFSDPVYKEIAMTNGYINRMTRDELRSTLAEFKLDTSYYDYICVVDFEATCEEGNPPEFIHEIIEFPVVLLNTHTLEIEDTFQQYVKPEINPKLSEFCVGLTGITQDVVDKAETFPQVLQNVVDWMRQRELGTKYSYCMLTDGFKVRKAEQFEMKLQVHWMALFPFQVSVRN
ncbi:hypothetical protein CIB84_013048 [Bambusicola thoracicus]|uniref:Exonuclease domain-containing protein n=1 Tax=Bambusicola thoracicus TaxID=9083 RepID=A0A2P4SGF1_BAMTH|nr:hypothetical protein CIB84_013048 [Bambusicola thoracicus]